MLFCDLSKDIRKRAGLSAVNFLLLFSIVLNSRISNSVLEKIQNGGLSAKFFFYIGLIFSSVDM